MQQAWLTSIIVTISEASAPKSNVIRCKCISLSHSTHTHSTHKHTRTHTLDCIMVQVISLDGEGDKEKEKWRKKLHEMSKTFLLILDPERERHGGGGVLRPLPATTHHYQHHTDPPSSGLWRQRFFGLDDGGISHRDVPLTPLPCRHRGHSGADQGRKWCVDSSVLANVNIC